jgi:hypothetical protein
MSGFSGVATVRNEPRSSMGQQKSAFHDEHGIPRRGQLLDRSDQSQPFSMPIHTKTDFRAPRSSQIYPKIQQVRTDPKITNNKRTKKDKSCVIS